MEGVGLISGQGIKIPHALQHSQQMKWNKIHKFLKYITNKDLL